MRDGRQHERKAAAGRARPGGWVRAASVLGVLALLPGVMPAAATHLEAQPTGPYPTDGSTPDDGYLLVPEKWTPTVKLALDQSDPSDIPQTSDKVKLRYQVRPAKAQREPARQYPAVLVFQGYNHIVKRANGEDVLIPTRALFEAGYVVVGVTARGTGCSSGTFDPFSPTEAKDMAAIVEWIAEQKWSDGNVALIGSSYAAIEALVGATEQPPHLRAVSAVAPITDVYRDVASPGGILNQGVPTIFEGLRAAGNAVAPLAPADDEVCHQNQAARAQNQAGAPALTFPQHPHDDDFMRARSSVHRAHLIDVPVQAFITWQDQVLGSRAVEVLERLRAPYYALLSNGDHGNAVKGDRGVFGDVMEDEVIPFLNRYVKGELNGYETTPPVRVMWETSKNASGVVPAWVSEFGQWPPPPAKATEWQLSSGGRLDRNQVGRGSDSYAYVPGSGQSPGAPETYPVVDPWQRGPAPGASLAYTSSPLERDTVTLGSASLDLRLSSSAADTDVQVVLTEVRPDGQEVYVQRGWLRASHRQLDNERSTPTRPYHVHRPAPVDPSTTLDEVEMRVEIRPFGHVFRAGSRIRVYVEAPSLVPDYFGFASLPAAATNTIHYGGMEPSRLVLPVIPGRAAEAPMPTCEVPVRYRCRPAAPA